MNLKNKKKGAPEGTPISEQDNGTTPERKSHAQMLFDSIRTGSEHALSISNRDNREFRKLVAKANMSGDIIINNGHGYFRPGPDDEDEVRHYIQAELHRAKEIEDKAYMIKDAYYGRY
jgi:hypothetical protein